MSEYCKSCYKLAEQLHRYKQAIDEIKDIYMTTNFKYIAPYADKIGQIIQRCEELK